MPSRPFPILVIDDDPHLETTILKASSVSFPEARFTCCLTYSQALTKLAEVRNRSFRMILLDINLDEDINGLEKIAELKDKLKGKQIPIIVLTYSDHEVDIARAYQLGAASFIQKPATHQEWINCLAAIKQYWLGTATLPPMR